jgi:NodT family efflux transporter outer membrane factor (OMF) lipoprotein
MAKTKPALLAVLLLAGCTVGPDFQEPHAPAATGFTAQAVRANGQSLQAGADIPADWWTLFRNPALDSLVRQALENNPDLQSAGAALRVAMEGLKAGQGLQYPTVGLGLAASRNKDSAALSPVPASSALFYNLYQTQLSVSWSPDLWGGTRRQIEALQALADAQRDQLEATRLALVSNVAATAIQEAALREQIAATQAVVDDARAILDIAERQQALGQVAGADVEAQRVLLAQAQANLPPLQKQLAVQRGLLNALVGKLPAETLAETFRLNELVLPSTLPLSLPSRLVAQRPDIRMAEENLRAASAAIGVATANRLPNLTLTADLGSVATNLGHLFAPGNEFWTLGAGVAQPLLDGGNLRHRERAAEAAYDVAAAQYRSIVIGAFRNVSDTLHAIASDSDLQSAAEAAERDTTRSLEITRRQVELGQSSRIALLLAEQSHQQAVSTLIQARSNRLADSVALFQALGGGWWNEPAGK